VGVPWESLEIRVIINNCVIIAITAVLRYRNEIICVQTRAIGLKSGEEEARRAI
jgi:hypothetical protein